MKGFTKIVAASVLAISAASVTTTASAMPFDVSGTFILDIYNFNAGGVRAKAAATEAVRDANLTNILASIIYTGDLDFGLTVSGVETSTIGDFLDTGNVNWRTVNSASEVAILDSTILSTRTFQTTTLFEFTANTFNLNITDMNQIVNVRHDDGIRLSDGSNFVTNTPPGDPTVAINTAVSGLAGNSFNLLYVAANSDPSILKVQAIPLPAAAWMLFAAAGGLIAAKRRRAAQA